MSQQQQLLPPLPPKDPPRKRVKVLVHPDGMIEDESVEVLHFDEEQDADFGEMCMDDEKRSVISSSEEEEEEEKIVIEICRMAEEGGENGCSTILTTVTGEWEGQLYDYPVCSIHLKCSICQDSSNLPTLKGCFCKDHVSENFDEFFLVCETCENGPPVCPQCAKSSCIHPGCERTPVDLAFCYHMCCPSHRNRKGDCSKCVKDELEDLIKLFFEIAEGRKEMDQECAQTLTNLFRENPALYQRALNQYANHKDVDEIPIVIVRFVEADTGKHLYNAIQPESKRKGSKYRIFTIVSNFRMLFEKFFPEVVGNSELIEKYSPNVFPKEFIASIEASLPGGIEHVRTVPGFCTDRSLIPSNVPPALALGFVRISKIIEQSFKDSPLLSVVDRIRFITECMEVPNFGEFRSDPKCWSVRGTKEDEFERAMSRVFLNLTSGRYPFIQYCILQEKNECLPIYSMFRVNVPLSAIEFECIHSTKVLRGCFDTLNLQYKEGGTSLHLRKMKTILHEAKESRLEKQEYKECVEFGGGRFGCKLPEDSIELYRSELTLKGAKHDPIPTIQRYNESLSEFIKQSIEEGGGGEEEDDEGLDGWEEEEDLEWCSDSEETFEENLAISVLRKRVERREHYIKRMKIANAIVFEMKRHGATFMEALKQFNGKNDEKEILLAACS